MSRRLDWNSDGANWPNRQHSRFVEAGGLTWHVQVMGEGPTLLLLHGTGASSHSFRDLAPLLAKHFTVAVPDLPGHGFTSDGGFGKLSLDGMALALGELLRALGLRPALGVGHSAGAAVLLRMDIDELIAPDLIVSLNGALQPFAGLAGQVFAPIARMLALMPVVPGIFAWRASDPNVIDDLLKRTGSKLDPDGVAQYRVLAKNAAHVGAALGMMANWDLPGLKRDLGKVRARVLLIAGALDEMVPPSDGVASQKDIVGSQLVRLKGLGHLAHEEQPSLVARLIEDAFNVRPLQLAPVEGRDMGAASASPTYLPNHNPARGPRALASGTQP
jgi:magnesium chelatase accessory protein